MSKPLSLLVLSLFVLLAGFIAPQDRSGGNAKSQPPAPRTGEQAWPPKAPAELQTIAESSGFKATSTHEQVVQLMDKLAAKSPLAKRFSMGKTSEGRDIPVITFADPPVATPEEARQAREQGKLVVLLFANIHAGEVDAKEALLMLARELATHEGSRLPEALNGLVVAIAPIYNGDGNEKFGPINERRPGQDGPEMGAGNRHNAQDFDLNRDFVKLEAPETRALVRFIRQWDPGIIVDGHTTNGSLHRFLITYAGPKVPAGDGKIIEYTYDKFLPALTDGMKQRAGIDTFLYGNFIEEHTQWETFPAQPRYGTNYFGLRNRFGLLSESYSYASYEDRIRGTLEFSREILSYAAGHKDEIRTQIAEADQRAASGAGGEIALRSEPVALAKKGTVLGFEETRVEGQRRPVAGAPEEYEVEILDKWQATQSVALPFAYFLPPSLAKVVENLQRHGIEVEELREDLDLDVTAYRVDEITKAERPFQGHALVSLKATAGKESRRVEAGTIVVRTNQPLGALAAFLLEPMSEDGLATWNFFDEALKQGGQFPVMRLDEPAPLLVTATRPLAEDRVFGKVINYEFLYGERPGGGAAAPGGGAGGRGRRGGMAQGAGRPNFSGSPIGGLRWVDDDHYLQNKNGRLYRVSALTGAAEPAPDAAGDLPAALAQLPGMNERVAQQLASRARFNEDRTRALLEHGDDLYVYDADKKSAVRLTETREAEEMAELSPDGNYVSFVRGFDLYVVDVATQTERALTTGGTETLRNGKNDWVYFEELYGRSWKAYWWSPDSTTIAFFQTDSSMVDSYTLTNDLQDPVGVETSRYPKTGSANPQVKLGLAPVSSGEVRWADLSSYKPEDLLISGVGWWPDGSQAYFFAQNREQTWLDVCAVSREGGSPTKLFRDETEAWVDPQGGPWVLEDGSFLYVSDRSGWRHLYRFDRTGKLLNPVTSGEWDFRGLEKIDEAQGIVYFMAMKDNPIGANLYRVNLDGSGLARMTKESGSHNVTLSPSGTRFIDSYSSRKAPAKVALYDNTGRRLRTLDTNPVYSLEEFALGAEEHFQIKCADGFLLEASLVKPPGFNAARKYPIWITTYAGPYAPTIRDAWGSANAWDQMLASEGIVVMRVDPRPASGKGPSSAWTAFRQLGVQELKDLEEAVAWLKQQPWADTTRVGLSGHSYGGYMTAYALTHSTSFSAGIAGAPVTDWREYDTIYTERYMGTPQSNPEGYEKSSVIKAAANLHGELLLLHGAIDDNVHPQNTIKLAKALQDAGKPFEMMIYPGMRHGIFGRHYNRLTYDFIRRTMGVDGGAGGPSSSPPGANRAAEAPRAPARSGARSGN